LWAVWGVSAVITAWTESEALSVFLLAGVLFVIVRGNYFKSLTAKFFPLALPGWMLTGLSQPANRHTLKNILLFFFQSGAVVFCSGLAIVPFLYGGVVEQYHWLNEKQFVDAVAVAMITPGPIIITVAFIGYLVAGIVGALLAAIGVFLPCYLFTIIPAP